MLAATVAGCGVAAPDDVEDPDLAAQEAEGGLPGRLQFARPLVTSPAALTEQDDTDVRAYWTPERMASAVRAPDAPNGTTGFDPGPDGPLESFPGVSAPTAGASVGGAATNSGGFGWNDTNATVATSSGRLFFVQGTTNFTCSATAVNSPNKSVVFTAAHCLYFNGSFSKKVVFAPGRRDGANPFGLWTANNLFILGEYAATSESVAFDIGAIVVNVKKNGRRLVNVVGGQGLQVNAPREQVFDVFGYPAKPSPPYNGERLIFCNGVGFVDFGLNPATNGLACDMKNGASGGAWLTNFNGDIGLVNSVNSYGRGTANNIYGPYFGNPALLLYNTVKSR